MSTLLLLTYFLSFAVHVFASGKPCKRSTLGSDLDTDSDTDDDGCVPSNSTSPPGTATTSSSSTSSSPSMTTALNSSTTSTSLASSHNPTSDPALNGSLPSTHKSFDTATLVALILGILVFILGIVIIILLFRRRQRKRSRQALERSLEGGPAEGTDEKRDPAVVVGGSNEKGQAVIVPSPPSTSGSGSEISNNGSRIRRAVMGMLERSSRVESNVSPNMSEARQGVLVSVPSASQSSRSSLLMDFTQSVEPTTESSPTSAGSIVSRPVFAVVRENRREPMTDSRPPPSYDSLVGH